MTPVPTSIVVRTPLLDIDPLPKSTCIVPDPAME